MKKCPFNILINNGYHKKTPQHIYQILTKRDNIMYDYFSDRQIPDNIWLGVTVENNKYKYRIETLKRIPAKIKFISFEPLLSSIDELDLSNIHWVIVGGESGNKAREMKCKWVDEIFYECKKQNIPFFFKQWGTWSIDGIKEIKNKWKRI